MTKIPTDLQWANLASRIKAAQNVQADWDVTDTTSDAYINNKPTIPTVNNGVLTIEKNGSAVATFSANADSNATANIEVPTAISDLTNDSDFVESTDLAAVATSGDYDDLINKPVIPTVNDATLTIQKNGSNVATFTANSATGATANIEVPTATSELTNDSDFQTGTEVEEAIDAKISSTYKAAGSTAFADLPALSSTYEGFVYNVTDAFTTTSDFVEGAGVDYPAGTNVAIVNVGTAQSASYKYDVLSGFVDLSAYARTADLATVATSGSYNDLTDKPTIPTVNDAALTIQRNGVTVATFTANSNTATSADIDVPTKTSDLTNDSGFLTSVPVATTSSTGVVSVGDGLQVSATGELSVVNFTTAEWDALWA